VLFLTTVFCCLIEGPSSALCISIHELYIFVCFLLNEVKNKSKNERPLYKAAGSVIVSVVEKGMPSYYPTTYNYFLLFLPPLL
jgi:hypothetical protein